MSNTRSRKPINFPLFTSDRIDSRLIGARWLRNSLVVIDLLFFFFLLFSSIKEYHKIYALEITKRLEL